MTDIVERLRNYAGARMDKYSKMDREAAAEIERLRAENEHSAEHIGWLRAEIQRLRIVGDRAGGDIRAATIEECAEAAFQWCATHNRADGPYIASAIRALAKEQQK